MTAITWDEMRGPDGAVRPHWQVLDRALRAFGPGEMWRRWEQARQLIRQHGVTFNVYGDARGLERPWPLDPVPVLLAPDEFARARRRGSPSGRRCSTGCWPISTGRAARCRRGCCRPRSSSRTRACCAPARGSCRPGGRFLHFYAADLVRTPEGELRVLADRTQAPAGAGYALENRIVLGRVLPEAFRESHAQRLALFFRTLRETLAGLAPHGRENPRIVLLTAGPRNATYFEQAFLAQYLGYPLVEGGDLTVRDGRVFLKTLGGLHPVDVILRRLNDDYCDPLELRAGVAAGRAGSAAGGPRRHGRDRERASAAASPRRPPSSRSCPGSAGRCSARSWRSRRWRPGGAASPRSSQHVLDHLAEMVIKPAYPAGPTEPIFGARLAPTRRPRS